jgi:hypothetical protein
LSSAFVRFFAATIAQCSSDRPVRSRNAFISRPATESVDIPSGRFRTGSSANASIAPSERTSETLLCASTATTEARPEAMSIAPVATPNSRRRQPSAPTLHRAQLVRHVLVEDRRSFEQVLRAADERVDLGPRVHAGVVVGPLGGLEHQLLVGDAGGNGREPRVPHADDGDPRLHERDCPIRAANPARPRARGGV